MPTIGYEATKPCVTERLTVVKLCAVPGSEKLPLLLTLSGQCSQQVIKVLGNSGFGLAQLLDTPASM